MGKDGAAAAFRREAAAATFFKSGDIVIPRTEKDFISGYSFTLIVYHKRNKHIFTRCTKHRKCGKRLANLLVNSLGNDVAGRHPSLPASNQSNGNRDLMRVFRTGFRLRRHRDISRYTTTTTLANQSKTI